MAELKLTGFSGGMSDYFVEGNPSTAKKLRNAVLDQRGRPYPRDGSEVWGRVPNNSEVKHIAPFMRDITKKYLCYATDAHAYYQQILSSTTSISTVLFNDGTGVTLGSGVPEMWSSRDHFYYPRGGNNFTKLLFTDTSSVLRAVEGGLSTPSGEIASFTPGGVGPGTASYNLYLVIKRTYAIGGKTFIDRSIPYLIPSTPTYDTLSLGVSLSYTGNLTGAVFTIDVNIGAFLSQKFDHTGVQLTVEFYQTNNGGTIPYLLGTGTISGTPVVTAGPFSAAITDLSGAEPLYTTQGAVGTGASPKCNHFSVVNDIGWFGNSVQNDHHTTTGAGTTQTYGANIVHQSVPGDIDGVPEDFFIEFDNEVLAVGGVDVHPLVWEKGMLWRIEGQFNVDGSGAPVKRRVAEGIGIISPHMINIGGLLVFAGQDQFYATDGFSVRPYSPQLKETYKTLVRSIDEGSKIRAAYVPQQRRGYFAMSGNEDSTANRNVSALCLNVDNSTAVGSFTEIGGEHYDTATLVGTSTKTLKRPEFTALALFDHPYGQGLMRGDSGGYLYWHDERFTSDPIRDDSNATTSQWIRSPVVMDIITGSWSFDSTDTKWFTKSELGIMPIRKIDNDPGNRATFTSGVVKIGPNIKGIFFFGTAFTSSFRQPLYIFLSCDRFKIPRRVVSVTSSSGVFSLTLDSVSGIPASTPMEFYISTTPGFVSLDLSTARDNSENYRPMKTIRERSLTDALAIRIANRYFPKGQLRGSYREMRVKSAYQVLAKSDDYSLATVASLGTYGTAVISGSWPAEDIIYGQWLHLENDGYATGYRIINRSGSTVQIENAIGTVPTGSFKWEVRGYAKDERPKIEYLTVNYQPYGQSTTPYTAAEGNKNA